MGCRMGHWQIHNSILKGDVIVTYKPINATSNSKKEMLEKISKRFSFMVSKAGEVMFLLMSIFYIALLIWELRMAILGLKPLDHAFFYSAKTFMFGIIVSFLGFIVFKKGSDMDLIKKYEELQSQKCMAYKPNNKEIAKMRDALSSFMGYEWGWDLFFYNKIGYLWLPVNVKGMINITSCELIESPKELFKRCVEESIFTLLNAPKSDFPKNATEQKAAIRAKWEPVLNNLPKYRDLFDQVLDSERTNIIQCARIILRNTDDDYLQKLLQDIIGTQYWTFDDMDLLRLSCEYYLDCGVSAEYLYSAVLESLTRQNKECLYRLHFALKRICEDGYDISGFGLVDIPVEDTFYFCNPETNQVFDMVAFNDNDISQLQPGYLDLEANYQGGSSSGNDDSDDDWKWPEKGESEKTDGSEKNPVDTGAAILTSNTIPVLYFAICLLASMVLFLAVRKKQHCDTRGEGKQRKFVNHGLPQ